MVINRHNIYLCFSYSGIFVDDGVNKPYCCVPDVQDWLAVIVVDGLYVYSSTKNGISCYNIDNLISSTEKLPTPEVILLPNDRYVNLLNF